MKTTKALFEDMRDGRGLAWLGGLSLDLKLGGRMLVKYPGLTIVGGLAMAFAISVGAVVFEMVMLFVSPTLPLPEGDRIVHLRNWDVQASDPEPRALHDFVVWREAMRSVTDFGAWEDVTRNLMGRDGEARPVPVAAITASGFRVAATPPLLGRPLVPADERAGAPPVVVLGHDVWLARFAGNSAIVGQAVQLGNEYATVVGVMPDGFAFPVSHDAWMPFRPTVLDDAPRLGPGITIFGTHNRLLLGVLAAAMLPFSALAQSPPRLQSLVPAASGRPVEVELRSAARAVAPGDTIPVAIRLLPNRGWHTYWRHAGDVGSAPDVTWRLPEGFTTAPLRWPTPERIEAPPLASYGYEREVHLLGAVHVPSSARVGSTAKLEATLTWVVCEVECVAGDVDVALTVPVAARTIADEAVARAFAAEAERIPARRDGWTFRAAVDSANVLLHVYPPDDAAIASERTPPRVQFFIDSAGVIDHAAQPRVRTVPVGLELQIGRSAFAAGTPSRITGVLAIDTAASAGGDAPRILLEVDAPVVAMAELAAVAPPTPGLAGGLVALATAGLLALLGGTLLNLMPCVLPVLSIKTLGIAQAAAHDSRTARRHVLLFGAGVLVSMWALVGVLLALRAAGTEVGWGYQLQNPAVVGALALLIFAAGLNMAGVFDLVAVGGSLSAAARRAPSSVEAFLGGVLVTALATPCSAPFLAAAVAYAVTGGAAESFVVFTALGLGLVWPLAMVAAVPRLRAWLPKPGAWMVTLRQVLAFPLFATVVWLAWVLGRQAGVNALVALLGACTLLAFGLWALGRFGTIAAPTRRRRLALGLAVASAAGALALVSGARAQGAATPGVVQAGSVTSASSAEGELAWRPYSAELLEAQRDSGRIVLLDFTADWCLTCKVNERVAFGSKAVRVAFRDHDVALLRADWTTRDSVVTRALAAFQRNSVPFVVLYPRARDAAPIIMPTLLTSGIVTGALERAAASPSPVRTSAALTSGRIAPSPSLEVNP